VNSLVLVVETGRAQTPSHQDVLCLLRNRGALVVDFVERCRRVRTGGNLIALRRGKSDGVAQNLVDHYLVGPPGAASGPETLISGRYLKRSVRLCSEETYRLP
jgi:hypothetical protein